LGVLVWGTTAQGRSEKKGKKELKQRRERRQGDKEIGATWVKKRNLGSGDCPNKRTRASS